MRLFNNLLLTFLRNNLHLQYEKANDLDHSHHHEHLLLGVALLATALHASDGQHEKKISSTSQ